MILHDGVHVVSTLGIEELHLWAITHRVKRVHFDGAVYPHYDIPASLRGKVFDQASQFVSTRMIVKEMQALYGIGTIRAKKRAQQNRLKKLEQKRRGQTRVRKTDPNRRRDERGRFT